jgi:hypothetical protein
MVKEWETEPDYITGKFFGLDCAIIRHKELKHLCGYVAVSKKHPFFKVSCWDEQLKDIDVHGGLTFASFRNNKSQWWFGFDCAHAWDYSPGLAESLKNNPGISANTLDILFNDTTYRNIKFVQRETAWLAFQLAGNAANEQAFNKAYFKALDTDTPEWQGVPQPT